MFQSRDWDLMVLNQVSDRMFAIDTRFTVTPTDRVTLVSDGEPNANAKYWLSFDSGSILVVGARF